MTFLKFVLVLFLSLNCAPVFGSERVEFSADRIHGLYIFVESIAGTPFRHEDIKRVFEASKHNTALSKQMLTDFRSLDFVLGKPLFLTGVPERNGGRSLKEAIINQSSFSKDLADLRERTQALMPMSDLKKLFKVLSHFEPIYNSLLWNPHRMTMQRAASTFQQNAKKWKLDDLFAKAAKFYGSDWPAEQKFRVSLFPLPPDSKHTNATAYGAVESVGVNPSERNVADQFAVVFHELCHSLYEAQPDDVQKALAEAFNKNPSKYSRLTYNYINEGLATALGNGWVYEKAAGKVDQANWYADEKINALAKGIFAKTKEYANQSKRIDSNFVNHAIEVFAAKFPDSHLEFQPALTNIVLISDGVVDLRDLRGDLRSIFRVVSMNARSPIADDETLKLVRSVSATAFAIVTQKQRGQIDSLDDVFKGISEHIELLPQAGNFLAMFDVGVRKVIVLIVDDPALVPKALKIMGQKKKVEKLNSFVELKFQP